MLKHFKSKTVIEELQNIEKKLTNLENKIIEQEHRPYRVLTSIYKYGFGDDKKKRESAWKSFISYVVRRQVVTYVIAISTSIIAVVSLYLAYRSNSILETQNDLIAAQNKRLDEQTYLAEAERRSSYVFLLANVIDQVREDLISSGGDSLSNSTIAMISSTSLGFKPYRLLEADSLSRLVSPERGQLLIYLVNLKMKKQIYDKIYKYTDFSYSEVNDGYMQNAYLKNAHLEFSNFKGTILTGANMDGANLKNANFMYSTLANVDFNSASTMYMNIDRSFVQKNFFIDFKNSFKPYRKEFASLDDKGLMNPLSMELFAGYNQIVSNFELDTAQLKYKSYSVGDTIVRYYQVGKKK